MRDEKSKRGESEQGEPVAADSSVVVSPEEARALPIAPLLVLEPLEAVFDDEGLGQGQLKAEQIGDGHSNATFLISRGCESWVLRRPPRPPFPPSTHDVVREAGVIEAAGDAGVPVPDVLFVRPGCEVIGAPFFVMSFVDGEVMTTKLPVRFSDHAQRARIGEELVEALIKVHAADWRRGPLTTIVRSGDYLTRQLRRFSELWDSYESRPIPEIPEAYARLVQLMPAKSETALVHGDFRLGNTLFASELPARLEAIVDWEMAAIGDPLADLGYLTSTWAEADDCDGVLLELGAVTSFPGFATRAELAAKYSELSGRSTVSLPWYEALACWKTAVLLEGTYRRHVEGVEPGTQFSEKLELGIPGLAKRAVAALDRLG